MDRPPRGGGRPGDHSIAPTEFFKHRSAPETRSAGQPRPTTPRLQHAVLERRTPRSRSRRPVGQRLPTAAYPRKSGSNSSQRPVIYRPHPHQKHAGLLEFRAPSRPYPPERAGRSSARPLPGPERTATRSARGRRPFKHETVHITTRVVSRFGDKRGAGRWFPTGVPSHRGPARQPGDRTAQSCSDVSRTVKKFASTPDRDDP
jgi:hypothetical protein